MSNYYSASVMDMPVQYNPPASRRDTPQLDDKHSDLSDSALTTMR